MLRLNADIGDENFLKGKRTSRLSRLINAKLEIFCPFLERNRSHDGDTQNNDI